MKILRILIVEDHRDTAETLAKWITAAGHDARLCFNGYQAEKDAENYRPHVVLLDIGLPDRDGWELAPILRRTLPSSMIAAVTGYQSPEDRQKSKNAGIDLHLNKPVHRNTVQRLLDSVAAPLNGTPPS